MSLTGVCNRLSTGAARGHLLTRATAILGSLSLCVNGTATAILVQTRSHAPASVCCASGVLARTFSSVCAASETGGAKSPTSAREACHPWCEAVVQTTVPPWTTMTLSLCWRYCW